MRTLPERRRERARIDAVLDAQWPPHQRWPSCIVPPALQPPANPENEHWFECPCSACSLYWTGPAGTIVFWDWMRRKPSL